MTANDTLLVRVMNRVQDNQRIFLISPTGSNKIWRAKLIRNETNEDGAWFNLLQPITFVEPFGDRKTPSYIEMKEDSDGFTHLAYFGDINAANPTAWLTRGEWEVTSVAGVNIKLGIVFAMI